jgi:hypothetical protein
MIQPRPRTAGRRLALATAAAVGLALGATGLPSAVATSPAPPSALPSQPHHPAPSHFTRGRVAALSGTSANERPPWTTTGT